MKKTFGFFMIAAGVLLILISILALVRVYDVFTALQNDAASYGYVIGSIAFPLLITVIGRWIFRKGVQRVKNSQPRAK